MSSPAPNEFEAARAILIDRNEEEFWSQMREFSNWTAPDTAPVADLSPARRFRPMLSLLSDRDSQFLAGTLSNSEMRRYRNSCRRVYYGYVGDLRREVWMLFRIRNSTGIAPHSTVIGEQLAMSVEFGRLYLAGVMHSLKFGRATEMVESSFGKISAALADLATSMPSAHPVIA